MRKAAGTEALERFTQMRQAPTLFEWRVWGAVRGRRLDGPKFRCQAWIGAFVAAIVCIEAMTIVDVDGSQHGEALDYDAHGDTELAKAGCPVPRSWNRDVANTVGAVLQTIRDLCACRLSLPSYRLSGAASPLPLPGEG